MQMAEFKVKGVSPMMMHSDRMCNPLDELTKELKAVTSKRKKTDADYEEMSRIEFKAGLYFDDTLGPYLPAQNIEATLINAGKLSKQGSTVKRALMVMEDKIPVEYKGPRTIETMYADRASFVDVRSVVVQRARLMRTRPIFRDWAVSFSVAYDEGSFNEDVVRQIVETAGKFVGFGDYRPRYGRFQIV